MYKLKNYMEDLVDINLNILLEEYEDICKCDKCILDIKAIALNNLKPRYGVTRIGDVYIRIDESKTGSNVKMMSEIIKAIEKVSKNPHNGDE
ncbi:MAG: late competence development ComFB family protein [Tepidibacter sp.]|uniref:late competence development ComFB family protein n=1 Tax=Tepidibacter sp. TaxID=2529387 RepID=UPI0025D6632D|nr:late competence development ComFB family protein [Tepidibacter sp.]MCT4509821.1 late competence development ComFB family protein [Tepidibacter sp.]